MRENFEMKDGVPKQDLRDHGGDEKGFLRQHLQENSEESRMKVLPVPMVPPPEEMKQHGIDHTPYRSWCRACVAGGGRADPHRKQQAEAPRSIPTVSCDYCSIGGERRGRQALRKMPADFGSQV